MRNAIIALAVAALATTEASRLSGQEQTERYIPIGQSPGISGKYAWLGRVEAIDASNRTVTVRGPDSTRTIEVTEQTRIWLDRSALKQTNLSGSFEDLAVGRTVEIKYVDRDRKAIADWIKVAVAPSGP